LWANQTTNDVAIVNRAGAALSKDGPLVIAHLSDQKQGEAILTSTTIIRRAPPQSINTLNTIIDIKMATSKAIVITVEGQSAAILDVPRPKIREEWMIVKTKAVALNPTDWKHIHLGYTGAGARVGCDYAGIVEEVGAKVTEFAKGDRVAGFAHGAYVHALKRLCLTG
jgi:hypothetical protein